MKAESLDLLKKYISNEYATTVLYIFPYGSQVYKTNSNLSDTDVIVVVDQTNIREKEEYIIKGSKFDCEIVTLEEFKDSLKNGSVKFVEAAMADRNWEKWRAFVKTPKIHQSFVEKATKSWNKAINNLYASDWDVVAKNAYHSLRILNFLLQIHEKGLIQNYSQAKDIKDKVFQVESIEEFDFFLKPWFEELFAIVQKQSINEFC